jgi:hypothetical protein
MLRLLHAVGNESGDDLGINLRAKGIVGDIAGDQVFGPSFASTLSVEVPLQPPDQGLGERNVGFWTRAPGSQQRHFAGQTFLPV